ncbi:hypothetical protein [Mycolicibacterium sp. GF69]|uniref:hypothetical protein n=1 Tax=Mycolicibacterium sp. GF69 TaxID=2267251 RepID=UPI001402B5CA|nr:hypothetical protein [Mycolicibacterium sp. GF69]
MGEILLPCVTGLDKILRECPLADFGESVSEPDLLVEIGDMPVLAVGRFAVCVRTNRKLRGVCTFAVCVEKRQTFITVAKLPHAVVKRIDRTSVDRFTRVRPVADRVEKPVVIADCSSNGTDSSGAPQAPLFSASKNMPAGVAPLSRTAQPTSWNCPLTIIRLCIILYLTLANTKVKYKHQVVAAVAQAGSPAPRGVAELRTLRSGANENVLAQ